MIAAMKRVTTAVTNTAVTIVLKLDDEGAESRAEDKGLEDERVGEVAGEPMTERDWNSCSGDGAPSMLGDGAGEAARK